MDVVNWKMEKDKINGQFTDTSELMLGIVQELAITFTCMCFRRNLFNVGADKAGT